MTNNTAAAATREYFSCAETATELRKALKAAFPTIKFSVRSHTYSGGASIDVKWTDGPTTEQVDRVAKHFAGATFDGMIDLKEYHTSDYNGRSVRWGADFVFTQRTHSPELVARACRRIEALYGITEINPAKYYDDQRNVCGGSWDHFWSVSHQVARALATMRGDGLVIVSLK